MNKTELLKAGLIACVVLLTRAQAQPTPAQLHHQQQIQQQQNMQGAYQADQQRAIQQQNANAAAQREADARWWAEERRIQANIERYKSTPYYGTLIIQNNNNLGWGGGGNITKQISENKAKNLCRGNCSILITFANSCVGAARPKKSNNPKDWIVFTNTDPKEAVESAFHSCEEKHGKGNCIWATNENNEKNYFTFCSGYNYEAYNQK